MNSRILSLLSPVLRKMVCGNFRESICKEIGLDDIVEERLLKLLELACGNDGIAAVGIKELLELGELADRLQMEAVRSEIEDKLLKGLRVENCLEIFQRSDAIGLELLQKGCYKMLRDEFGIICQEEGFLRLSEETMRALLEEDHVGVSREEDVFEAVVRWMSSSDDRLRGLELLSKIRYGVMSNEYLAGLMSSVLLPGIGIVKALVGEAMAKKCGAGGEEMWDGVVRLCDKWRVARGMKGRIIGADVLKLPRYVAIDGQGLVVVTDSGLNEVITFDDRGSVARRFGSRGTAPGQFEEPRGVAVDRQGRIVVADYGNHRIQVLNVDGSVARCFGSFGTAVGQLNRPYGVAIDRDGHMVVSDYRNHRIQVFDQAGSVVRHFGSKGTAIGQFHGPKGVAIDGAGKIVIVDEGNHRLQVFQGDGSAAHCPGSKGGWSSQLKHPHGVAVDSAGRFLVTGIMRDRIQVFSSDWSLVRVVGSSGDGVGELSRPYGVVIDGAGRIVVADTGNHRLHVL